MTPTELPPAITRSLLPIPYTTHSANPDISAMISQMDTSSVLLVLIALMICGTVLETANSVASIPIIVIETSVLVL
jgi:hypothetical protein